MERHSVLMRQLKRFHLSDSECPNDIKEWRKFLDRINMTYVEMDQDRYLAERSQVVSTREMKELHQREINLNKKLTEVAREAGMAEVATSVLHNVGNILNSINVASSILMENLKKSKLNNLIQIGEMLEKNKEHLPQFISQDPRGKLLPDYIINLAKYWKNEQPYVSNEIKRLENNISHVKNIIAMQQSISGLRGMIVKVPITELIEDALTIYSDEILKEGISIVRDYNFNAPILIDKIKAHQIMINLIHNARDALHASHNSEKKIILRVNEEDGFIVIEVIDNGIGIDSKFISNIFTYGFTTKSKGHGFGLHASANAAKEMGGSLEAISEGINQGARFIVKLPKQPIRTESQA